MSLIDSQRGCGLCLGGYLNSDGMLEEHKEKVGK